MSGRSIVAVSWCMPPALYPRSVQVARTFKGLRRLGWHSTVITASLASVPKTDVIDRDLHSAYAPNYDLVPVDITRVDQKTGPLVARWRERLNGDAAATVEDIWVKRAAAATMSAIRTTQPSALVTFAQPWRDHLVGLRVRAQHAQLPWVAHFSDPWTDSLYAGTAGASELANEAAVIEQADRVVFTNPYAAELVMKKYPAAYRDKARVVVHAMDPDLIPPGAQPLPAAGRPLRIGHFGNLFAGQRTAVALLDALAAIDKVRPLAGRLELQLVGGGSGLLEAQEQVFVRRLERIVTFQVRVPYAESLALMRASDMLLLIDAPAAVNVFLPSKLVDYLMAGRPVIALTPSAGAPADVMRSLGYPIVDPDDAAGIAATLDRVLRDFERGDAMRPAPASAHAQFSLEATATAFGAVLDEIVERAA